MLGLKCAYSEVKCKLCEKNPDCRIYSERYVLIKQLKKLRKLLEETQIILKAVLEEGDQQKP